MKIYKGVCPELNLKNKNGSINKVKISSSKNSYEFFKGIFDEEMMEVCESFMVVYLNAASNTVGWFKASQGGITGTVVDVRLILKKGLDCYATKMIVAHNHPCGNLYPSEADKVITKKLIEAGKLMGINLLDHIIITANSYYSFADEGLI